MRLIPRVFTALALMMLVISYQNFTVVDSSDKDTANTLRIIQEMRNFEQGQVAPQALAAPESGSDLKSVSNDWAQRQSSLLLNGYDKKLETAMNKKLNSWVQELSKEDPSDGQLTSEKSREGKSLTEEATEQKKHKQNLRFARLNSLKYDIGENSCLDLTADPGNTRFNYSQALNKKTKVGVEHKTADTQTQMFLRYDW